MDTKKLAEYDYPEQHESYNLYAADTAGNQKLTIKDRDLLTTVEFRRVSNHKSSTIQFSCQQYNTKTNRTNVISFGIPENMVSLVLEHLSKPWK